MALKWITTNTVGILDKEEIKITQTNQKFIDLQKSIIPNTGMIDIFRNGILLEKNTYREINSTKIEYLDEENPLQSGDVIVIRHHISDKGIYLGNIRVVAYNSDLYSIKNPKYNDIVIVTSEKKFYRFGDGGWEEWIIPLTTKNIGLFFNYEKQIITNTFQKTYTLNNITYNPNMNNLLVFINGLLVKDYEEIDNKTIHFLYEELPEGEIEFLSFDTDTWEDTNSHTVTFLYDSQGNIIGETILKENSQIRHTTFEYNEKGNIIKEIVFKTNKTIIKQYFYDENDNIINIEVSVS